MDRNGVLKRFPVQVALAALGVYLVTLSRGVTVYSLDLTAKVAGWGCQPMTSQPLYWLLTLPLRWLPAGWIPLALNILSAVCAAITLGLLAATLELAAWERPLATLRGWRGRLPLVLGVVVCGLEFNFWQAATQATGEALQLLVLAAAIWCLFKYRVTRELRWMRLGAFIWGVGMVENWMMLVALPLFMASVLALLVSLFWLGELRVFKVRDLAGLALAGLSGFSLFALLPTVNGLSPDSPLSLGGEWWMALKNFKGLVFTVYVGFWRGQPLAVLVVLVYFFLPGLPLLPALIRLRDDARQNLSALPRYLAWIVPALRAALLLGCLWLTFDPTIGLRQILRERISVSVPLLSFDYLVGLSAGFLAGNLLLALVGRRGRHHPGNPAIRRVLSAVSAPVFTVLLVLVTLGLLLHHTAAIMLPNRQPLTQFGKLALNGLPPGGGIVLGDEPLRVLSFQAAAAEQHQGRAWPAVNTELVPNFAYRRWLASRFPGKWTAGTNQGTMPELEILKLLDSLAKSNRVFYLHPSFGVFFESFYAEQEGLVRELKKYSDRSVTTHALTAEAIARTEDFWSAAAPQLEAIRKTCAADKPGQQGFAGAVYSRLYLKPVAPVQSHLLAGWYAVALNDWGVQLQRAGKLDAAQKRFETALALNEDNTAARINLRCNHSLLAGLAQNLSDVPALSAEFGSLQQLCRFLLGFGPVDDPSFCHLLGSIFRAARLPRQAMQQFERARTMVPGNPAPQLALAELYALWGFEEKAQKIIDHIRREQPASVLKTNYVNADLRLLEAELWLSKTNVTSARNSLQSALTDYPGDPQIENRILKAYLGFGDLTNALRLIDTQLARRPNDVEKLNLQATLLIQARRSSEAIGVLDHVLTLTNLPAAQVNHAVAHLAAGNYTAAESEYHELEKAGVLPEQVSYGLSAIAEHRQDTNAARHYLQLCLTQCTPGTKFWLLVSAHLKSLE